ncbi:MAG: alpha/beta fold hydrolase [Pseudomonadota bacterium]
MKTYWRRLVAAGVGGILSLLAVWQLENARSGLSIETLSVGSTPITVYQRADISSAPAIVVTHGFAGSRQLMEAYSLTLAQAGYVVAAFDFLGHGRNPVPMSGDVEAIDGTTRLLMNEIAAVTDVALGLPGVDGRVALLGHSMASDIIVRQAMEDRRVRAVVAISMFSEAVTPTEPRNLLIISGEWEGALRSDGLRNLRLAEASASEGETVGDPASNGGRRAVVAPNVEHVGVLYSQTALEETRTWLDAVFQRSSAGPVSATGIWIILLLAGLVILAWPLSKFLPDHDPTPPAIGMRVYLLAVLVPAVITPLVLSLFETRFLPVLVADYLAVHLLVYGTLSIGILSWNGVRIGHVAWLSALAFAAYGIFVFGGALDRYVASFMPVADRLPIIGAIAVGAVATMTADSLATEAGRTSFFRVILARGCFLASLGAAVALDFERLFFLIMIIPIILLYFIVFGLMGGWVGRRTHSPGATGLALGLILAWSLGVSFPLFSAA